MMGMLYPVSFNHLYFIADFNGKEHTINRIALFDLFQ